ncbi:MAG TPA: zinc ribbon domain-containing protein [Actinomycetota bacterium]|nr:zinc ribbon domain-containing protein [Actinomycetota bacterium]
MEQRPCDQCGAENRPDAAFCWRCHARWDAGPAAGPAARLGGIRSASFGSTSATAVVDAGTPPPHAATSAARSWPRLVLTGLLFAAGFAGGWWLVDRLFFSGFPFPDQVDGQPRIETDLTNEASEVLTSIGELFNVEMEMAFYGTDTAPAYMMFAFELPDGAPLPMPAQVGAGGDVGFQCQPDDSGSACVWSSGETVVGLGAFGRSVEELEPVARQVQAELGA